MSQGLTVCGKQCVSPPFIHSKSRMRKRARTDLRGGRSAMVVPTATTIHKRGSRRSAIHLLESDFWGIRRLQERMIAGSRDANIRISARERV